jgi:hypothetical protein
MPFELDPHKIGLVSSSGRALRLLTRQGVLGLHGGNVAQDIENGAVAIDSRLEPLDVVGAWPSCRSSPSHGCPGSPGERLRRPRKNDQSDYAAGEQKTAAASAGRFVATL